MRNIVGLANIFSLSAKIISMRMKKFVFVDEIIECLSDISLSIAHRSQQDVLILDCRTAQIKAQGAAVIAQIALFNSWIDERVRFTEVKKRAQIIKLTLLLFDNFNVALCSSFFAH